MYPTTGATIRGDLNTFVEEAASSDKFFIGQQILPPFGVDLKSGTYPKLAKTAGALLKGGSTILAPKTSAGEIDRAWGTDTYDCVARGLQELIADMEQKDMSRFFNMEVVTAKLVLRAMMIDAEIRVAAAINSTGNFDATAASVNYTEANIATINVPLDITAAIERVNDNGEEANTIVMSPNVFNRIKRSTLLQSFMRGVMPATGQLKVTPSSFAAAFAEEGITQCLIGRARYDSAKKGQTFTSAKIWGDTYVWVGHVTGGDFALGGAGRTLTWNPEGGLFVTETFRDENRMSNIVRVRQHCIEKIVNGAAGTLITTSYS